MTKFRIILIDDDELSNRLHLHFIKRSDGFSDIRIFNAAKPALDYLKSIANNPELWPHIISLDINMPLINGFGFLEEMESDEYKMNAFSRVIMLSSSLDANDINKSFSYPSVLDFIGKPLSNDKVSAILEKLSKHNFPKY